jgi:hypothetical protein
MHWKSALAPGSDQQRFGFDDQFISKAEIGSSCSKVC